MPAVMINGVCEVGGKKQLNGGQVPHITLFYRRGGSGGAGIMECKAVVDALQKEFAERKVTQVAFVMEKKKNSWNKSYPLKLTDDNRWLYQHNSKSDNPRAAHVEIVGTTNLAGSSFVADLSTIHFA
jgi:hypothetical protein